jgi:hypothetical protein
VVLSLSSDGKTLTAESGLQGSFTMTRATGSDDELAQKLARQANRGKDSAVKEGIHALQVGVQSWAVDHNDRYPPVAAVCQSNARFASYVDRWPDNPFTDAPMALGSQPGDFTYTTDGKTFTLTGHLFGGEEFTVP